ncbi:MAG: hypothetical protein U0821_08385 [Chloroflexota bacterium]
MPPRFHIALLGLILLWYTSLAIGYALVTPRWNNPDEPAHFNYARTLARDHRLPVLSPGDWDADLLERLKASRFPNDADISTIRYEGHQPPLYYLLAAGVLRAIENAPLPRQVFALKLLSIGLGTLTVTGTFLLARVLAPGRPALALVAAAVAAYVPMNTAMSAAVNNDSLANGLAALTLAAIAYGLRRGFDDRGASLFGFLLGALLLTKVTVYGFVALGLATVAAAEYTRLHRVGHIEMAALIRRPLLCLGGALAVSGWWFARGVQVYGWNDPLGLIRHDLVVVGQPRFPGFEMGAIAYVGQTLFRSFWGQFGWMGIVLDERLYSIYLVLTLAAMIGWLAQRSLGRQAERRQQTPDEEVTVGVRDGTGGWLAALIDDERRLTLVLMVAATALVFFQVGYYNLTYVQAQGRYLFPALGPISIGLAAGWLAWCSMIPLGSRWRRGTERSLSAMAVLTLLLLNAACLLRFVAPAFRP